jgi:GxxExxY protein
MNNIEPIPVELDKLAKNIVDAAYKVHATLGPGLLESVYEKCLIQEFKLRGIKCRQQVELPIIYEGVKIDAGLRIDIIAEESIIVELKSTEQHNRLFEAQLLSYLKLANKRLGLLINFNVPIFKQGIKRIAL